MKFGFHVFLFSRPILMMVLICHLFACTDPMRKVSMLQKSIIAEKVK